VARQAEELAVEQTGESMEAYEIRRTIAELEEDMVVCAKGLQFERAALLRDQIRSLKETYHVGDAQPETRRRSRSRA
jgi:excinuclease ABC subunit B